MLLLLLLLLHHHFLCFHWFMLLHGWSRVLTSHDGLFVCVVLFVCLFVCVVMYICVCVCVRIRTRPPSQKSIDSVFGPERETKVTNKSQRWNSLLPYVPVDGWMDGWIAVDGLLFLALQPNQTVVARTGRRCNIYMCVCVCVCVRYSTIDIVFHVSQEASWSRRSIKSIAALHTHHTRCFVCDHLLCVVERTMRFDDASPTTTTTTTTTTNDP